MKKFKFSLKNYLMLTLAGMINAFGITVFNSLCKGGVNSI